MFKPVLSDSSAHVSTGKTGSMCRASIYGLLMEYLLT